MAESVENPTENPNNIPNIDINGPDFYENVQTEIESDIARMKKTIEVVLNLRVEAAEIEVQTAALYHAELWYDLLELQNDSQENSEDEDDDDGENDETDSPKTT